MDKESIIELQKIDCNCNDCKFMVRDQAKFHYSTCFHYVLCLREFTIKQQNILKKAQEWYKKTEWEKGSALEIEAENMAI